MSRHNAAYDERSMRVSEVFQWSPSFLTGLSDVDDQHRQLVALINELGALLASGDSVDSTQVAQALTALREYGSTHFREEEALMVQAGLDPRHTAFHQGEHRSFVEEILVMSGMATNSAAGSCPVQLSVKREVGYLVNWLAYHILGVDQAMTRQMRAIEAGTDAAEAFEADIRYREAQSSTEPLLAALNGLLGLVSARNRDLAELNRTLEQRVLERTLDLERANERLKVLSFQDDLTGLPNRRHALAALEQLWAQARIDGFPLSVLMLDADRFKRVNDQFGHAEGDAVLRALAGRLGRAVRTSDIVCRLGGDEFLVICPRSGRGGAAAVAEKILAGQQPHRNAEGETCWSGAVSIGIAEVDASMTRPEEILKAADEALYQAKRSGGARSQ
jgi:diguanylate cyclase (GGDEF)-like protein/hemerythrin-like metal-binding protein